MEIEIAIPTMGKGKLEECVHSLHKNCYEPPVIVNLWLNGSVVDGQALEHEQGIRWRIGGSEGNIGVVAALQKLYEMSKGEILGYLHDDVEISEWDWDLKIREFFEKNPKVGLAGFHGAGWLGQPHIYKAPYELIQLARGSCRSNMLHAEAHGVRDLQASPVACVDGFSMFCRREFLDQIGGWEWFPKDIPHHVYDTALACMAKRNGWEVHYLPFACHHYGGMTATKVDFLKEFGSTEGDIHSKAHAWMYEEFRDVLPIQVS